MTLTPEQERALAISEDRREQREHYKDGYFRLQDALKQDDRWRAGIVEGEKRAESRNCTSILLDLIHDYCRGLGHIPPGFQTNLIVGECDLPILLSDEQARQFEEITCAHTDTADAQAGNHDRVQPPNQEGSTG